MRAVGRSLAGGAEAAGAALNRTSHFTEADSDDRPGHPQGRSSRNLMKISPAFQRYMHLSPAAIENAIRLLDQAPGSRNFGDMVETGAIENTNSFR
jgi:hypothetical protein